MSILLICCYANGDITLDAECIERVQRQERHYSIRSHHVILDGYPDAVLHHDADTLLAWYEEIYRMPTAEEQETFMAAQRSKGMIQEGGISCQGSM